MTELDIGFFLTGRSLWYIIKARDVVSISVLVHLKIKELTMFNSYDDANDHISLARLVSAASFPVYGIATHSLPLTLCSIFWGRLEDQLVSIAFSFSNPCSSNVEHNIEIGSLNAHEQSIVYESSNTPKSLRMDHGAELTKRYHLSEQIQTDMAQKLESNDMLIAGNTFTGDISYWSQPHPLSWFLLRNRDTILTGTSFGLSERQLIQLLQALVIVNHHENLIAQYQSEFDQTRHYLK